MNTTFRMRRFSGVRELFSISIGNFLKGHDMYLLEEINKRAAERPEDFIDRCRREYESEVERAVDDVLAKYK